MAIIKDVLNDPVEMGKGRAKSKAHHDKFHEKCKQAEKDEQNYDYPKTRATLEMDSSTLSGKISLINHHAGKILDLGIPEFIKSVLGGARPSQGLLAGDIINLLVKNFRHNNFAGELDCVFSKSTMKTFPELTPLQQRYNKTMEDFDRIYKWVNSSKTQTPAVRLAYFTQLINESTFIDDLKSIANDLVKITQGCASIVHMASY
jgi:hypothetical protein